MSRRPWPWSTLGIDRTDDTKAVRKAYADKLKTMDLDRDAAAYEMLRNARDVALAQAKARAAPVEAVDDEWSLSAAVEPTPDDFDFPEPEPSAAERYPAYDEAAPAPEEAPDGGPDRELNALLFPNGEHSDAQFDEQEEQAARSALRQVIAEVQQGDLTRQQMGDYWIADRLATAWPRSAPLVAEAAEAFEWEKRHGQLGEGPAQAFITARLNGMRFYEAVRQPGHWGHRAWQELSTPEKKRWWQRNGAGKGEKQQLLAYIREHHPELESLLDWEKVSDQQTRPVESPWPSFGTIVVVVIVLAQVARFCGAVDRPDYQEPPEAVWTVEDRDALVSELFGPDVTYDEVLRSAPIVAQMVDQQDELRGVSFDASSTSGKIIRSLLIAQLRRMILNSDQEAEFDQLVQIKQLKLHLVNFAYSQSGASACVRLMDGDRADLDVPAGIREAERRLAAELLSSGKLWMGGDRPAMSARIPGELFAAAETASGVSGAAATRATQGEGTERERCLFRKALLAEALRRPGTVTRDLLLIL